MRPRYTVASQGDIEQLFEYITNNSSETIARNTIYAITATCEQLADFPTLGRRRPELDELDLQVRSIGEQGYVILYTLYRNQVYIVRIIHHARDLEPEFRGSLQEVNDPQAD